MKAPSREPQSRCIAARVAGAVVKGPGVRRSGSRDVVVLAAFINYPPLVLPLPVASGRHPCSVEKPDTIGRLGRLNRIRFMAALLLITGKIQEDECIRWGGTLLTRESGRSTFEALIIMCAAIDPIWK